MFLSLLNVSSVGTFGPHQFLGELVALAESFCSNFDAVLEVVEFVLKDLK